MKILWIIERFYDNLSSQLLPYTTSLTRRGAMKNYGRWSAEEKLKKGTLRVNKYRINLESLKLELILPRSANKEDGEGAE